MLGLVTFECCRGTILVHNIIALFGIAWLAETYIFSTGGFRYFIVYYFIASKDLS